MRGYFFLLECALLLSLSNPLSPPTCDDGKHCTAQESLSGEQSGVRMATASSKQLMLLLAPPQPAPPDPNTTIFYHSRRCGQASLGSGCTHAGSDWTVRTGIMGAPTDSASLAHLSRLCRLHCTAMANCVAFTLAAIEGTDNFRECKVYQLDDLRELVPCLTVEQCYSPRNTPPSSAALRVSFIPPQCSHLHDQMSACVIYTNDECDKSHIKDTCQRNCCIRRQQQQALKAARSLSASCVELQMTGPTSVPPLSDRPHRSKRVFWVSSMNAVNPGDVFSQPLFGLFPHLEQRIVGRLEIDWNAAREADALCLSKQDLVIIGGGGLLHHSAKWTRSLLRYCQSATCLFWASGFNKHIFEMKEVKDANRSDNSTDAEEDLQDYTGAEDRLLELSAAAALRDYNREGVFRRMLDASCLLPHFDLADRPRNHCAPVRDVGWYLHADSKKMTHELKKKVRLGDLEYNDISLDAALQFICSSRVVFSMSYHGVLWAVYFGRPVVAVGQFSEKFDGFPFALRRESLQSAEALVDSVKGLADAAEALAEETLTEVRGFSMTEVVQPVVNASGLLAACRHNNTRFYSDEVLPLLELNQAEASEAKRTANSLLTGDNAQYADLAQRRRLHEFVRMVTNS